MKKAFALLLIPLVLGCITGGGDEETTMVGQCLPTVQDGLVINEFYPELREVYSGETISFTMDIQNLGASEASKIEAEVYNLGGFTTGTGTEIVARIPDLEASSPDMPAIVDQIIWSKMLAPAIGQTGAKDIKIGGSLSFDYSSSGQAYVVYIPKDEWRRMRQEGTTAVDMEQDCSNGPVGISIEPMRQPTTGTTEFTVRVVVSNLGTGKVKSEASGMDYIDAVYLTLDSNLETGSACDFTGTGEMPSGAIKLVKGQEKVLSCKVMVKDDKIRQEKYKITARADYRYIDESVGTVSVTEEEHTLALSTKSDYNTIGYKITDDADCTATEFDVTTKTDCGDETLTIRVYPVYDGAWSDDFTTATKWSATIKNDDTKAIALAVDGTPTKETVGGKDYVELVLKPAEDGGSAIEDAATVTVTLSHGGTRSSTLVEDVPTDDGEA